MSLRHDRYVETATDASVYNYGYVSLAGKFRDIMSYNSLCAANAVACTRINYFSTPLKTYNGYPIGIPQGTTGAADAARKITESKNIIAGFRGGTVTTSLEMVLLISSP